MTRKKLPTQTNQTKQPQLIACCHGNTIPHADVAETLNLTMSATRALVSSGELPAIQVGGKHVWRIEESVLEQFIQDQYAATRERQKAENPQ